MRTAGFALLAAATLMAGLTMPSESSEAAPPPRSPGELALWYTAPATDWESEALPIGNGASGAMVFGDTATEHLQLNEKTLWTGGPGAQQGYDFGNWRTPRPNALSDIRTMIN